MILSSYALAEGDGHRRQAFERGAGATAGEASAQHGSLLGRRRTGRGLGVDEEFSAEGRLGRAAAARRRAEPRDGLPRPEASDETHASTTDPDAHLYRKGPGKEADTIAVQGGEIAFGALEAGLEVEYARDRSASTGPGARKAMRSRAKEPPNSSTTARSRSSSPTTMAMKPSSRRNGTPLQQPASSY